MEILPFVRSRSAHKGHITRILAGLESEKNTNTLDEAKFKRLEISLNNHLNRIEHNGEKIAEIYDKCEIDLEHENRKSEMDKAYQYLNGIQDKLAALENHIKSTKTKTKVEVAHEVPFSKSLIKCQNFNGNSSDRFDFKFWLSQFETMINSSRPMSGKYKLSILRNNLTPGGLAFKLIADLDITDANFDVAINALKDEFLDIEYIRDELLAQILSKTPKYDPEFENLRLYVAEIKSILNDLKKSYHANLLEPESGGYILVSHIVFKKIPPSVQKALMEKTNNIYPTIDQIFEHTKTVINTILKTKSKNIPPKEMYKPKASLEHFQVDSVKRQPCRLCQNEGHTAYNCRGYVSLDRHKARCAELKICTCCLSSYHEADSCPGNDNKLRYECRTCKIASHISAMCPKDLKFKVKPTQVHVCYNTGIHESYELLPIVTLKVRGHSGKSCSVNFLFDTGSQRSYLSKKVFDTLGCNQQLVSKVQYKVNTFVGSGYKNLLEANIDVFTGHNKFLQNLFLIDDKLNIQFLVNGLKQAVSNVKDKGYRMAADLGSSDNIQVQGLIGIDLISHFRNMHIINCMNGSAWSTPLGVILMGDIRSFLTEFQIQEGKANQSLNFSTLVKRS